MLSCVSFLYSLDVKPLSDVSFAHLSVGGLLILFMVSFTMAEPFSLMKSHFFIFAFVAFA